MHMAASIPAEELLVGQGRHIGSPGGFAGSMYWFTWQATWRRKEISCPCQQWTSYTMNTIIWTKHILHCHRHRKVYIGNLSNIKEIGNTCMSSLNSSHRILHYTCEHRTVLWFCFVEKVFIMFGVRAWFNGSCLLYVTRGRITLSVYSKNNLVRSLLRATDGISGQNGGPGKRNASK